MATIDLTADDFAETVSGEGIVLIDWWAEWCGPCRNFAPIFEEVSGNHPDVTFAKIDTEAEQMLSTQAGIQSIPTLMVFRDGILLFSQAGAMSGDMLEDVVGQAKALDMDQIRREIAEHDAEHGDTDAEAAAGEPTTD